MANVKPLGLSFRIDDLADETRVVRGEVAPAVLDEVVGGMIGELGYRAESPASVEGSAYTAGDDVVFEGRIRARIGYDCVRCLTSRALGLDFEVRHLLVARAQPDAFPDDDVVVEPGDDDETDELYPYDGDNIDLAPLIREDVLLELPMNPSCRDATGAECEEPLKAPPEPEVDPRWAPLLDIKKKLS
jgi:uncharacterized protein